MSESPAPIPVICDRCRAEGSAGDGRFAEIADLLTFDPVPRRAHVNNWTAEHQRAFIAALAMTGSPRQAARALGRHAFGADQLRTAKGGRSFAEAWDAALELYRERELYRIKSNLGGLADQQAERDRSAGSVRGWADHGDLAASHLRALPPPPSLASAGDVGAVEPADPDVHEALSLDLITKFARKLQQERTARLDGRIVEADFYLRQLTFFEVAIEMTSGDLFEAFSNLRRGEDRVIDIADTPASRVLDSVRRELWELAGEPERPPPPPDDLMKDHGDFRTEPLEFTRGGIEQSHEEQMAVFRLRHEEAAAAQVAWERRAHEDWAARQPSSSPPF